MNDPCSKRSWLPTGGIAVRIMRTLRAMSIRSVAVSGTAGSRALHVSVATIVVTLDADLGLPGRRRRRGCGRPAGPQPSTLATGSSPKTLLARRCADAGDHVHRAAGRAIEVMGDKIRAKRAVAAAGVPVVPDVTNRA